MRRILPHLESIESASWKGRSGVGLFHRPEMRAFYFRVLPRLAERGNAEIATFDLNGTPIAYQIGLTHPGYYRMHSLAFLPEYGKYSPGQILMLNTIESALTYRVEEFDFLQGRHPFKSHYATESQTLYDSALFQNSPSGLLNYGFFRLFRGVGEQFSNP